MAQPEKAFEAVDTDPEEMVPTLRPVDDTNQNLSRLTAVPSQEKEAVEKKDQEAIKKVRQEIVRPHLVTEEYQKEEATKKANTLSEEEKVLLTARNFAHSNNPDDWKKAFKIMRDAHIDVDPKIIKEKNFKSLLTNAISFHMEEAMIHPDRVTADFLKEESEKLLDKGADVDKVKNFLHRIVPGYTDASLFLRAKRVSELLLVASYRKHGERGYDDALEKVIKMIERIRDEEPKVQEHPKKWWQKLFLRK